MIGTFKLNHAIAENVTTEPKDVLAAKRFLHDLGFYKPPEWGISQYPDHALIDAIRGFQSAHGLRVDGVMKPGGESEKTIRKVHAAANQLQDMGRRGDSLLAHITPAEARLLKAKGGAGTVNPATGLLEFYKAGKDDKKKEGEYIWRTAGDRKVRSSHAKRDGEIFLWDEEPDGGHPGDAPNCRCWAEDIKEKEEPKKDCEKIYWELRAARQRHDALFIPIENAQRDVNTSKNKIKKLRAEKTDIEHAMKDAPIPSRGKKPTLPGTIATGSYIYFLQQKLDEINEQIGIEEQTLADQEKTLEKLENEREDHRLNAEELSRRYQECIENNKK